MSQLVDLTSGQQERSGNVLVGAFPRDGVRLAVHWLAPENLALRTEALGQARPGLLDCGEVFLAIQHPMVDAPSQSKAKETAPAGLGVRKLVRVVEVDAPQAIGSLALDQLPRLPAEDGEVALPAGVRLGKILQHSGDSGKRPTIPA